MQRRTVLAGIFRRVSLISAARVLLLLLAGVLRHRRAILSKARLLSTLWIAASAPLHDGRLPHQEPIFAKNVNITVGLRGRLRGFGWLPTGKPRTGC